MNKAWAAKAKQANGMGGHSVTCKCQDCLVAWDKVYDHIRRDAEEVGAGIQARAVCKRNLGITGRRPYGK